MEEEKTSHLLTDEQKWLIVLEKKAGKSNKAISSKLLTEYSRNIHPTTVQNVWDRYLANNSVENQWNMQGRPRRFSDDDRDDLEAMIQEDRLLSARQYREQLGFDASRETINREMINLGYKAYKAPPKPLLSESNKQERLDYAQAHSDWQHNDWTRVVFTDESPFHCVRTDGRTFVRRRPEESIEDFAFQPSVAHSRSIMVWGAISIDGVGPLVKVNERITGEVYLNVFRYRLRKLYPNLYGGPQIFQDDNARPHRAGYVNSWFESYDIERLDWPPRSPDLNIIEDVWGNIKYRLRNQTFDDEEALWLAVKQAWNNTSIDYIEGLYGSLPDRIQAVINAQGGNTKY